MRQRHSLPGEESRTDCENGGGGAVDAAHRFPKTWG
jgi:hypothetical protein